MLKTHGTVWTKLYSQAQKQIKLVELRTGLTRDTIRFYERNGLITPPRRRHNGYRIYDELTLA